MLASLMRFTFVGTTFAGTAPGKPLPSFHCVRMRILKCLLIQCLEFCECSRAEGARALGRLRSWGHTTKQHCVIPVHRAQGENIEDDETDVSEVLMRSLELREH